MRSKTMSVGVGVVIGLLLAAAGIVLAGSLNPTAGPTGAASQMYTLEQIYNRMNTGVAGTKMTAFTEPGSGPTAGTGHTLDEIMAKAPALDATNGAGVADVASGKTFWGLTAGAWGLQTGTASGGGGAGVPKTGLTTSYATGDDGALLKGVAWPNPRFTDNSNGTVTDNLTGLIWLKDADCMSQRTWDDALTQVANLNSGTNFSCDNYTAGTFSDWRLPNVREMQSLVHYGFTNPAVPNTAGTGRWTEGNPFTGVQSNYYWTSTTRADFTIIAWYVFLTTGSVLNVDKTSSFYVWSVRGGQ